MNILFIGDIFGKPGRKILINHLEQIKKEFTIDLCLANGENLAGGKGVTEKTANKVFNAGVDVLTGGNHLWDQKVSFEFLQKEKKIVKPLNHHEQSHGFTSFLFEYENLKVLILSLLGQAFMNPTGLPFQTIQNKIKDFQQITKNIIIDFHAEATAEKRAMGFFLDGKITALLGTHTHIQTADEEILPQGTAYITDVGMTGPHNSIIGMDKKAVLQRTLTGMPARFVIAKSGLELNAVIIQIDEKTGKAVKIQRLKRKFDE